MAPNTEASLNLFALGMGLFGGLALFLFGLDQLSEGLKQAAGDRLKVLLTRLTANRFLGSANRWRWSRAFSTHPPSPPCWWWDLSRPGSCPCTQSVAVIMGANIGSTVTAQLLAFNVSAYALLPVAVGFFMLFAAQTRGDAVLGHDADGPGACVLRHGSDGRGDEATALLSAVCADAGSHGEAALWHRRRCSCSPRWCNRLRQQSAWRLRWPARAC